uniref:LNS2 domain-containing protein n=1 Tax=Parastrongyloides trichosuri TaxID=131310 RepID=A0A0N4Z4Q4_PARTI
MNCLIPSMSTCSNVPVIFLEARIHGSAKDLVSQLGITMNTNQCDVSIMTKTSGILIIAGVSSYCAYKLCGKFFGRRFVWTLLDSKPLNVTKESKIFTSTSTTPNLFEVDEDVYKQIIMSSDNEKESDEEIVVDDEKINSLKKYHVDLTFPRKDYRKRGLTAISYIEVEEEESQKAIIERPRSLSRLSSSSNKIQDKSSPTNPNTFIRTDIKKDGMNVTNYKDNISTSSVSVKSATFNLTWDAEPMWDDEFYGNPTTDNNRPSSADISCGNDSLNSVGLLFRNILDEKIDNDDYLAAAKIDSFTRSNTIDDVASEFNSVTMEDLSTMINSKCMQNSKHLYKSVVVGGSEFGKSRSPSICSFMTDKSNISKLREKMNKNNVKGLVELSPMFENDSYDNSISRPHISKNIFNSPMTDSLLSKESFVSSNAVGDSITTKSAFSSKVSDGNMTTASATPIRNFEDTGSIMTKSLQSLEWCDDDINFDEDNSFNKRSLNNKSALDKSDFQNNINIGMDHETYKLFSEVPLSSKSYSTNSHYSMPQSQDANKFKEGKKSTIISGNSKSKINDKFHLSNDLRLHPTRDFMVVMRENFKSVETTKLKVREKKVCEFIIFINKEK